ncbi:hypothetical protein TREMEDRAFT_61492 [Tremella mesenterica DSM 1558]|uniref:uncharacterized protein n=1 Tax=Tremella mesenterica (strain ATCC 24925 / CBS 8224 / DSM 1558 / NBRC 9311 / NRRL Y-6157 / RJB 2259-6 / UBC 559-6) TaxID=578456 RepID=UPI0003F4956D|nr:uncharacterized protein TREMEDRAFT_61492 [Tremella mesenterica DSM 1558]EIW69730.1 hypothetical protein TREMEDRAFT_61492 [Tremella mesenterica DSM 1558]
MPSFSYHNESHTSADCTAGKTLNWEMRTYQVLQDGKLDSVPGAIRNELTHIAVLDRNTLMGPLLINWAAVRSHAQNVEHAINIAAGGERSSLANPLFSGCCSNGAVQLPLPLDPPLELRDLLTDQTHQGKLRREQLRNYNNSLAFTSMGVDKQDMRVWGPQGIYTFRIGGRAYHQIGALLPEAGEHPRFAQVFLAGLSEAEQAAQRNIHIRGRGEEGVLTRLAQMIERVNPYYAAFKTFRDLYLRGGGVRNISELHSAYLPLHFTLIYPHGEPGWHPRIPLAGQPLGDDDEIGEGEDIEDGNAGDGGLVAEVRHYGRGGSKRVTQAQFATYYLFKRSGNFNTALYCGRLFQELLVDQWAQTESNRL